MSELKPIVRVLIIEDELLQRKIVTEQLVRLNFVCEAAASGAEALKILQTTDFDVVLLDLQLGDISGLSILPQIKKIEDAPEVVILTGDNSLESGIAAMRDGAYDYLVKPASSPALEVVISKAAEKRKLVRQNLTLRDLVESRVSRSPDDSQIIGASPAMRQTIEQAKAVAELNSTILITGESGTGKDVLARYIHQRSLRNSSVLVTVNCGAIPENLFESEFFGYEKGAFSGAEQTKRGLIEAADGSTLFLDEIGEMPPNLQVKLLRFLENGEFRRVGGTRNLFSNVRLIAATNQDLTQAIKAGRFRADLFYRLNVILFQLTPLRERPEDLRLLIDHFIDFYAAQFRKTDLKLTTDARQKLETYDFPGNIRELKNIVERAAVLAPDAQIKSEHILFLEDSADIERDALSEIRNSDTAESTSSSKSSLPAEEKVVPLAALERQYILAVLTQTSGNREKAASLLGISERTLYRRLRDYE